MKNLDRLTPREYDVLRMMAGTGKQWSLIAEDMNLSRNTVVTHVKRILEKLEVDNRTQASRIYWESQLPPLFQPGVFVSAAGIKLPWKVQCDTLTEADWDCIASSVGPKLKKFGHVEGVPTGGEPFARALLPYRTRGGGLLIAEDVLTTGGSMEKHRGERKARGVVLFARGEAQCPTWVKPVWKMSEWLT